MTPISEKQFESHRFGNRPSHHWFGFAVFFLLLPALCAATDAATRDGVTVDSSTSENVPKTGPQNDARDFAEDGIPTPSLLDGAHNSASELLKVFAHELDNYFAEEIETNEVNNTSAMFRVELADTGDGKFSAKGKIKLRLVLPRSEQRLRLLFDADDDELGDNSNDALQQLGDNEEDQNLSLAFRFIKEIKDARFNLDVGGRRHESLFQTFVRLRVSTEKTIGPDWSYSLNNDLRHYYKSGNYNQLGLDFWRPLNKEGNSTILRTSTKFTWRESVPGEKIVQSAGLYKELNPRTLLAVEAIGRYNTELSEEVERHYEGHEFRVRYRRNMFRRWFHFEIWPGFRIDNDSSSSVIPVLATRFEIEFGK